MIDKMPEDIVKISNNLVEFHFSSMTGSLVQVLDTANGKEYLSELRGARLFRLLIPNDKWVGRYADSHESSRPVITEKKEKLEFYFEDILCKGEPTGIQAWVTVTLPENSREAKFKIKLKNNSDTVIQEVRFPWVGGFKSIDGPGRDKITIASKHYDPHNLLPQENPHTFERWREKMIFEYPYPLMLPYMDISGEDSGLGYICYLGECRFGVMGFERLNPFDSYPSLSWAWASSPFIQPGQEWCSHEIGILVHQGDWHKTADRFREWVDTWWKAPESPVDLRESIGLLNVQFTTFEGEELHKFSQYPALAQEALDAGINHICIWHRAGGLYCMNGSTREIMDEPDQILEELRAALAKTNEKGINTSIILNLRIVREFMDPYKRLGESEMMRIRDGSPASRESYSVSAAHLANMGPHYNSGDAVPLCQRPDGIFSERSEKIVSKMLDLGFTSIFIDQPINFHCCFAEGHHHDSPDKAPDGAIQWMRQVSEQVRNKSAESYVIGELPELFQTQNIDLWWHWQWKYLNPEVYRYSLPEPLQMWVIDGDVGELNRAFVMGYYANLTPAGMERGLSARPEVAAQCKLLAELRKKTANWTVYTRFMDKLGLAHEGSGSYEVYVFTGENKSAVIIGETGNGTANVNLNFSPAITGSEVEKTGTVYRLDGSRFETKPADNGTHTLQIVLKPYDVAVWTFGE